MIKDQFYSQQGWPQMIHGYCSVYSFPGAFCPFYNQVAGSGQIFYTQDSPKPVLDYQHLDKEIQAMSVLQIRDWIWNLGSTIGWELKDSYANAISFCKEKIDGSQLVNMEIEDLCKLNVAKKLGHKIAIIRAVKALKRRSNVMEQHSQTVCVWFTNESSPLNNTIVFPNTESAQQAFQERRKVGYNYHRPSPSKSDPITYEAYGRVPVAKGKSASSEITTHIEKGTVSINML